MSKKVHVIHHTHWDFEWYFTTNESFVQLTYHLEEMMQALETKQIDYYLLDGQMSILDDYLINFPKQKERLSKLVKAGKLVIGPWYTQTDELIIRGESVVRNLNLGMDLANSLGGHSNLGYLPDSFGQSKDMPKIYNGLGIDKAVFWRGVSDDVTTQREFYWEAEDDSKVLVANIKDGYFVGVGLIYSDDEKKLMKTISKGATTDNWLLPVGGDQRYIDFNLKQRIELYNQKLKTRDIELLESNYAKYFKAIATAKLQTIKGELLSGAYSKIHRSIYSSRYDHKYLNDKIERRMIYQVEPLMVMAKRLGIAYQKGLVDRIWKLLNKNHAHDSAGGCNSDKTNRIILNRFIEADQLSYSVVDYLTRKIAESKSDVKENELIIFNTLPYETKKVMKCRLSTTFSDFKIQDEQGKDVAFEILQTTKASCGSIRRWQEDMDPNSFYFVHDILIDAQVPALSFRTYQVVQVMQNVILPVNEQNTDKMIENAYYAVKYIDGKLVLLDKKTQQKYDDFLQFEDSGDEGDTYDYSPPYEDYSYLLDLKDATCQLYQNALSQKLVFSGHWQVAKNLQERARKERHQSMAYQLTLELLKDSSQLQCHLEIENQADDHRMRILIKTPHQNTHSYSDTLFGTIKRPVVDPHLHDWKELGWSEEPTSIYPMLTYVNSHDENSSWTVFSKGIKEYQLIGEKFGTIALTLYRSVGYLGRPDLLRRPGVASGNEFKYIPTPDSQLHQRLKFKFALQLDDKYQPAKLTNDYLKYAVSLPYYQIQEINRFTTSIKYFVSNKLATKVTDKKGFTLMSETVAYSALLKTQDDVGFDLRVYNPDATKKVAGGFIQCYQEVAYCFVDLAGNAVSSIQKSDMIPLGTFKPGEIKTVHIVE